MMDRSNKMLIVIFDGEHARYVRSSESHVLHTEKYFDSATAHQRTSDLRSDHPGGSFHSDSSAHHAIAPRHDPHMLEMEEFACFVAKDVNAMPENGFDALIIAAPRRSLAVILDKLHGNVEAKLTGVLAKDLTKVPDDALWPHLREFVQPPNPPRYS